MVVVEAGTRVFMLTVNHQTVTLTDPNPDMTPMEVSEFYSKRFPSLTTCTVEGPRIKEDQVIYEFKSIIGTKG